LAAVTHYGAADASAPSKHPLEAGEPSTS